MPIYRPCMANNPADTKLGAASRAFGHKHSATVVLEQRLREAIGARIWPLVGEIAKKLAKQDRQAV